MFDTNDVFDDAVRGSSLHAEDEKNLRGSSLNSKIFISLTGLVIVYGAFSFYKSMSSVDESLVITNQLMVQSKIKTVVETPVEEIVIVNNTSSNSEEEYLRALRDIETELIEERKDVTLDTNVQFDLSMAMNDIVNDVNTMDSSTYTKELTKEINPQTEEDRVVIVKKGDTLETLSKKFYGDAMNYKRIIASNDTLINNDSTIYVGQTITLPY